VSILEILIPVKRLASKETRPASSLVTVIASDYCERVNNTQYMTPVFTLTKATNFLGKICCRYVLLMNLDTYVSLYHPMTGLNQNYYQ
jgi:hypothetical protein